VPDTRDSFRMIVTNSTLTQPTTHKDFSASIAGGANTSKLGITRYDKGGEATPPSMVFHIRNVNIWVVLMVSVTKDEVVIVNHTYSTMVSL
jgi:hypothetical protein